MGTYTVLQWLTFFYLYCFLGWCYESTYDSIRWKKPVNRGFMHGPWLPIYGSGACIILFTCLPVKDYPALVFLFGMIAASTLEFCTGVGMEALFKVRYWDYTSCLLNIRGYICLKASILWGVFSLIMTYVIQEPVQAFVFDLNQTAVTMAVYVISALMAVDFAFSMKKALDIRSAVIALEKAREELKKAEEKLEVLAENAAEARNEMREAFLMRMEDAREDAKDRYRNRMDALRERMPELPEFGREEISDALEHLKRVTDEWDSASEKFSKVRRSLLRRNPTAVSRAYRRIRSELREKVSRISPLKNSAEG